MLVGTFPESFQRQQAAITGTHLKTRVRVVNLAAYVDEEMLVVGVMQPLLLHEGGVLDQPELVGGDGPSDPGRRGRGWRGGLGGGGQVEGTRGEGLHTEERYIS